MTQSQTTYDYSMLYPSLEQSFGLLVFKDPTGTKLPSLDFLLEQRAALRNQNIIPPTKAEHEEMLRRVTKNHVY